ncbi:hypothetical protein ACSBR2_040328 [Camellia fascicularis]
MATSSRDARRRRIADRGSDRLALITGRIQTLPSSSSSSSSSTSPESHHSHTASCPPSLSHHHDPHLSHHHLDEIVEDDEDKSSSSLLPQYESANDGGSRRQPFLRKCETGTEASRGPSWEVDAKVQAYRVLPTVEDSLIPPSNPEHKLEPLVHHRGKIFTPKQISSAIAASESTRIYCSLAAAILVVLSYIGFPILGSRIMKSIMFFKPLYLVLLTNISIVLARLLLGKQRRFERIEQEANNVPSIGDSFGFAEQLGKALESGLVLQNIMGAVFVDCSIYAIVVICGLSMAQKLGW